MSMLAPYTNAMRLGQGFNSYTQQICLDKAVVIPQEALKLASQQAGSNNELTKSPDADVILDVEDIDGQRVVRRVHKGQSQIVTYTAKFIDKLSDITEALNVSASLSIKTGTVGGTVKGSYVDTDKFKSSDMNFTVQVKVVNQRLESLDFSEFNMVETDKAKMREWPAQQFTKTYGDCFISGWETGGELNALISVKVLDKSKTNSIKGDLEGSLGTPALSCEVKGGVNKESNHLETNTETTVSVNYSGGGRIKDENVLWNINSLTLAAANFADRVADTPQKIYAILTKYTSLMDYQQKMVGGSCSPLIYENANIYTNALLDNFMDYKAIFKQIQIAMWELENKRATAQKAKFSEALKKVLPFFQGTKPGPESGSQQLQIPKLLGDVKDEHDDQAELSKESNAGSSAVSVSTQTSGTKGLPGFVPNLLKLDPYEADVFGLEKARRECRLEMVKIVNEVEVVTLHPEIALDPTRDHVFLPPVVYRQILPVVIMSDNTDRRILGTSEEAEFPLGSGLWLPEMKAFDQLDQTLNSENVVSKALHFRVDGSVGQDRPGSQDKYFNAIAWLNHEMQPQVVEAWCHKDTQILLGMRFLFTNGAKFPYGVVDPPKAETTKLEMKWEPDQQALFVNIGCVPAPGTAGQQLVDHVSIGYTSNTGGKVFCLTANQQSKGTIRCFKPPLAKRFWDFRGFYGAEAPNGAGFSMLGPIWCNHKNSWSPPPSLDFNICPGMEVFPQRLRDSLAKYNNTNYAEFRLSRFGGNLVMSEGGPTFFNTLDDPLLGKGSKLRTFRCVFRKNETWLYAVAIWNVDSPKPPLYGKNQGSESEIQEETLTEKEDIVGCTVFSAKREGSFSYCIGLQLLIESKNGVLPEYRSKRFVSAKMAKVFDNPPDESVKALMKEYHSEVLLPPREEGKWVIRGLWGQVGDLVDRLGVVWMRVKE